MPEVTTQPKPSFLAKPFSFIKTVLLPVAFSILANGIFAFVFLGGWLAGATLDTSIYAIVLFTIFLLGFPFLYFWLAKKQAILKGISWLYHGSSTYINQGVDWLVSAAVKGQNTKILGMDVNSAIDNLEDLLPNSLKTPLKFLLNKLPLYDFIEEIGSDIDLKEENLQAVQLRVQEKVDDYVEVELLGTSSFWMWGLMVFNILAMVMAWVFFA